MNIYRGGVFKMDQQLIMRDITIDIEGIVAGMEHLVVGKHAHVIIRWVDHNII